MRNHEALRLGGAKGGPCLVLKLAHGWDSSSGRRRVRFESVSSRKERKKETTRLSLCTAFVTCFGCSSSCSEIYIKFAVVPRAALVFARVPRSGVSCKVSIC